jgi:hypothetical protein
VSVRTHRKKGGKRKKLDWKQAHKTDVGEKEYTYTAGGKYQG